MRGAHLCSAPRLRNDLYCVERDVKLYYTILYLGRRCWRMFHAPYDVSQSLGASSAMCRRIRPPSTLSQGSGQPYVVFIFLNVWVLLSFDGEIKVCIYICDIVCTSDPVFYDMLHTVPPPMVTVSLSVLLHSDHGRCGTASAETTDLEGRRNLVAVRLDHRPRKS